MIRRVWLGSLLLLTALLATYPVEEPDLWFHLALGRHIVTQRTIPAEDPFVYSSPPTGAAWLRMHWLWQVVAYRLQERIGVVGLNVLKVIAITAIVGAALAISRAAPVALLAAPPAIALSAWRFHARPELVTWALMLGFLAILERERRQLTHWPWLLPLGMVLWVNMHVYFLLGWVILAAYLVEAFWEARGQSAEARGSERTSPHRLRRPTEASLRSADSLRSPTPSALGVGTMAASANLGVRLDPLRTPRWLFSIISALQRRRPIRLIVALGLCIAAALLNPSGVAGAILPLQYLVDIARAGAVHLRAIHEQQPLLVNDWFRSSGLWGAYGGLVTLVVVGWVAAPSRRIAPALLLVFLMAFSWLAVRNIPLLALGAVALAPSELAPRWRRRLRATWRVWNPATRRAVRSVGLAGILLVTTTFAWQIVSGRWYLARGRMRQFGLGVAPCLFPDRAVDWLEVRQRPGRLFTNFDAAGYLLWRRPDWPVYFHGCADFRSERFRDYIQFMTVPERHPGWLQAQGVETVLLAHTAQDTEALIRQLAREPGWRLAYLDDTAVIFRTTTETSWPPLDTTPSALRRVAVEPTGGVPWLWASYFRGRVLGLLGWADEAIAVLEEARRRYPEAAFLLRRLGYLYAQQGRWSEAATAYEQALALEPTDAIACYDLGVVYLRQQRPDAVDLFHRALRYRPDLAHAHHQLAVWYAYKEPSNSRLARRHMQAAQRLGMAFSDEFLRDVGAETGEGSGHETWDK